jgi:hypothetical protein
VDVVPGSRTFYQPSVCPGTCNTLHPDIELVGAEISELCAGWERNVAFTVLSYDEARQLDSSVDSLMVLAQNAGLGAHNLILEDGPILHKESGPHAEEGDEIPEGMYTQGCSSLGDSMIVGRA